MGKRLDSVFKLGGLFGKTTMQSELDGIDQQQIAITQMENLRASVMSATSIDPLKKFRTQLGLAELPQELVADYDEYQKMISKGVEEKDRSLEVDWLAINEQLKQGEAVLDRWETAIQVADTGMGIAVGLVPGGSLVYEISHALTDVATGMRTPDQAARDFAFGVLASAVGGKALKKLNVDELASVWAKKNAKYFSKKTAESLSRVVGKTAAGATQGAISGTAEGVMHGTYNVTTGKATVGKAIEDTVNRATIGAAFGGVMGGGMEGLKIRGESNALRLKTKLRNSILELPETEDGRALRILAAENILGRQLSNVQKEAVLAAHDVPMKNGQRYSPVELRRKMQVLEASRLSRNDAIQLLRMGVCGAPPLPPVPPKNPQKLPPPASLGNTPPQPGPAAKVGPQLPPAPGKKLPDVPRQVTPIPISSVQKIATTPSKAPNTVPLSPTSTKSIPQLNNAPLKNDFIITRNENKHEAIAEAQQSFPFISWNNRVTQFKDALGQSATIAWERSFDMPLSEVIIKKYTFKLEGVTGGRRPFSSENLYTQLRNKSHPDHALLIKFEEYIVAMLLSAKTKALRLGIQFRLDGVLIENRHNFEVGSGKMIKIPTEVFDLFVRESKAGNRTKIQEFIAFLESRVIHEMTHKAHHVDNGDEIATHALQFLATDGESKYLNAQLLDGVKGAVAKSTETYDVAQNASLKLIYLSLWQKPIKDGFKPPKSYHPDDLAASLASLPPKDREHFQEHVGKNILSQTGKELLQKASQVPNLPAISVGFNPKKPFESEPYFCDVNGKLLPNDTYTPAPQGNRWLALNTKGALVEPLLDGMRVHLKTPGKSQRGTEIPEGEYTFTYAFNKSTCDFTPALCPTDNSTPYTIDFSQTKLSTKM